jgi:deoxycytidylate deaminase
MCIFKGKLLASSGRSCQYSSSEFIHNSSRSACSSRWHRLVTSRAPEAQLGCLFYGRSVTLMFLITLSDGLSQTLASLASRRSNCMKRRVGAILVRENRILATGYGKRASLTPHSEVMTTNHRYNGTPRGLKNCNEGGCSHCNEKLKPQDNSQECLCLHAEENALLEAGRERVGRDCVLYCNTYVPTLLFTYC